MTVTGDDGTDALRAQLQISPDDYASALASIGGGSSGDGNKPLYWGPWQGNRQYTGQRWEPPPVHTDFYSQVPAAAQQYALTEPEREMFKPTSDYYSQVPQVYGVGGTAGYETEKQYLWRTVDGANAYATDLLASDPEEFYRLGDRLFDLGYFENQTGYTAADVLKKWGELASIAANYSGKNGPGGADDGKVPLTMNQVMYLYSPRLSGQGYSDIAGSSSGADRLLPSHDRDVSTTISSKSEIKGLARDLAQRELGRDLNDRDLSRLTVMLQGAQAANPRVTITDVRPTSATDTETTHKIRGGLDAQTYVTDKLREDPNYAEHQAAAVYAPALMAALGATV